jgi:nucleoside-diphosphate-sugar epimerase
MSGTAGARVLVVGGAGFVGSALVRRLLADGAERVVVVDNFLSSEPDNVPDHPRLQVRRGSIADDDVLASLGNDVDLVFHLATYHGNQSSIANPLADHANNLFATLKLFDHLAAHRAPRRVVYASTGCALAEKEVASAAPVTEDGLIPLDFDSPYQISKIVGEMYGLYYHRRSGLPVVRARFQNVYGPGEVLGAGAWRGTPATIWRNVVPTFVYRALKKQPLLVDGDGSSRRDFIFIDDIVEGLLRCAAAPDVAGDVFNLASGRDVGIRELAELVNAETGNVAGIVLQPRRDWDRSIARVGSTTKASARLGFEARVDIRTGLASTVTWTAANLARIERCIRRHAAHCPVEF